MEYDRFTPLAARSSCTRTRFPLQVLSNSRICWRWGSAFSGRSSAGTWVEFERRILRTVSRLMFSTRAISLRLTPCACSSRIVVRCAWLNMLLLLCWWRGDFRGQTIQFLPHAIDLALRREALRTVPLDGGAAGQSPIGPAADRRYHLQIAQQCGDSIGRRIGFALPLRF